MSSSTFNNPYYSKIKEEAKEERKRDALPAKYPKINSIFDGMVYKHDDPIVGKSLGMESEEEAFILADKFQKAEYEARRTSTGRMLHSKTIEILMPTLTPKELAFCASHIVFDKQNGTRGF